MTSAQFKSLGEEALNILKSLAPIDTGNLRYNAIRIEWTNENSFELYVDERIAPYMPYTNEVWRQKLIKMGNFLPGQVVERMRTWRNPNEGWFDRAARTIALYAAQKTGGMIKV